jgi:hypothetical protein
VSCTGRVALVPIMQMSVQERCRCGDALIVKLAYQCHANQFQPSHQCHRHYVTCARP